MRWFVLLVVAAVARPAVGDEAVIKVADLLPLAVGNSWTYKVSGQEDRFVVRVVREEMVGEQTCFRLEASLRDRTVATEHLAYTKDGLCRFRVDKEDVVPPVCILKYPPPKGPRWRQHNYQVGGRSVTGSFTPGTTGDVTAGGKKYKALTVEATVMEGPGRLVSRTLISYAAGVGIVKQEIIAGKNRLDLELEKFEQEAQK